MRNRLPVIVIGTALASGLAVFLLWPAVAVRIPPGHVGVLHSPLSQGTDTERLYSEGLALKLPWDRIFLFDTGVQAMPFQVEGLSADSAPIAVEATALYRLGADKAPMMARNVGPDYGERVVKAASIAELSRILAETDSQALHVGGAAFLSAELTRRLQSDALDALIEYQDVRIRRIGISGVTVHAAPE